MSDMRIQDSTLRKAQQITGQKLPMNWLREQLQDVVNDRYNEWLMESKPPKSEPKFKFIAEPEAEPEPPKFKVDWEQYGMGYIFHDPKFTRDILPWFIEQCGGEPEAEAKVLEKLNERVPITNPRKWVAGLYYEAKKLGV